MIGTVEQAIIDRLKLANENDVFGYNIREIDSYGGQANDDISNHTKTLPAIWVVYDGANPEKQTNAGVQHTHKYMIVVATKSLRNESESRRGGVDGPGAYQLIRDIVSLMHGFIPVPQQTKQIRVGNITPIAVANERNRNAAVYAIGITTAFMMDAIQPVSTPETPLEKIHTNWDLPPIKIVGALPDDENADATDHLTGENT